MPSETEVRIPDIGDFDEVEVIEVLVAPGDVVAVEDSLLTLESDKASMEIPSPIAGVVKELKVAVGDHVSEGAVVAVLVDEAGDAVAAAESGADVPAPVEEVQPQPEEEAQPPVASQPQPQTGEEVQPPAVQPAPPASKPPVESASAPGEKLPHASPLVRGFARELGVDLSRTLASGPSGRVLMDDVKEQVRSVMAGGEEGGAAIPAIPEVDFSLYGPVEAVKLSKIRRVSATRLHRSWLNIPHVTQHDEADVTELEAFRRGHAEDAKARGLRLSPLLFLMKAVVISLRRFPDLRSSLAPDGQGLIRKNYYHLGIAVDTEEGLVVPVVRDVDQKTIYELAAEVTALAEQARARKLAMDAMQGGVFTISSLGGIGGTAFTPIVNAPEVGILGVSRTTTKPLWRKGADGQGGSFEPRQVLPLSLSYDHRVVDGAVAVRFTTDLVATLSDPVNLLV
jgi:pyruvate dehydrogenase E2 component (dihydrolipoamide acetyltransferase)